MNKGLRLSQEEGAAIWDLMDDAQKSASKYLLKNRKGILDIPTGIGKTLCALLRISQTAERKVLILGSKSSLATWRSEFTKWLPHAVEGETFVIVEGSAVKRKALWEAPVAAHVATYKTWLIDSKALPNLERSMIKNCDILILDECHKTRNRKTLTYEALKTLGKCVPNLIGLTGTLASRGPQDLWGLLHLCDPKIFSSFWKFTDTFCRYDENFMGYKEYVGPKNTEAMAKLVAPYIFKLTDEQLAKLPPSKRHTLEVTFGKEYRKHYVKLLTDMYLELDSGEIISYSTTLAIATKCRQYLACPKVIHESLGYGSGIEAIMDKIESEEDSNISHCVIYTSFTSVMPHLKEYIHSRGYKDVFTLVGGTDSVKLKSTIDAWSQSKGIMLCSLKFAQSFNLGSASTGFFLAFDWDPNENEQAEGRQKGKRASGFVNYYYVIHSNTLDEGVREVINGKTVNVDTMYAHLKNMVRP